MQGDEDRVEIYGFESHIEPGKTVQEIKEEIATRPGVRFVAQFAGSFILFVVAEHGSLEEAQEAIADYVEAGFRTDWATLQRPGRVLAPKRGSPDHCAIVRISRKGNADPDAVLDAIDDVFEERALADPQHEHFNYGSATVDGRWFELLVDLGHDTYPGVKRLVRELYGIEGVGRVDPGYAYLPGNAIRPGQPEAP